MAEEGEAARALQLTVTLVVKTRAMALFEVAAVKVLVEPKDAE